MPSSLAAVRGIENTSDYFRWKMTRVAESLGMNPDHLAAIISFETIHTFSPSKQNASSGATGLIQFMPSTATRMGTTTSELALMQPEEQLDWVQMYLQPFSGRMGNLQDAYLAVFSPVGMGHPPDYVLGEASSTDPHKVAVYNQNSGLDVNHTGVITNADTTRQVSWILSEAQNVPRIEVPDDPPLPRAPGSGATSPTTPTAMGEIATLLLAGLIVGVVNIGRKPI